MCSLAGLAASLPVALAGRGPDSSLVSLVVSEGAILATCALFGVCYRYMIRRDTGNTHLKGGVVAAFGLTRGKVLRPSSFLLVAATSLQDSKLRRVEHLYRLRDRAVLSTLARVLLNSRVKPQDSVIPWLLQCSRVSFVKPT